jgi:hypothetical protein
MRVRLSRFVAGGKDTGGNSPLAGFSHRVAPYGSRIFFWIFLPYLLYCSGVWLFSEREEGAEKEVSAFTCVPAMLAAKVSVCTGCSVQVIAFCRTEEK